MFLGVALFFGCAARHHRLRYQIVTLSPALTRPMAGEKNEWSCRASFLPDRQSDFAITLYDGTRLWLERWTPVGSYRLTATRVLLVQSLEGRYPRSYSICDSAGKPNR